MGKTATLPPASDAQPTHTFYHMCIYVCMLPTHVTTVIESIPKPYATTVKSAVETTNITDEHYCHHPATHTVTASKYVHMNLMPNRLSHSSDNYVAITLDLKGLHQLSLQLTHT